MKKRIVVVVLAVFLAASAHAQAMSFVGLVRNGTPKEVQAAVNKGADLKGRDTGFGLTPLIAAAAYNSNP